jgi:hypothetical protein
LTSHQAADTVEAVPDRLMESYNRLLLAREQLIAEAQRVGDGGVRKWTSLAMLGAIDFAEQLGMMWDDEAEQRRAAVHEALGGFPPRTTTEDGCGDGVFVGASSAGRNASAFDGLLAALIGRPLDEYTPALGVRSARPTWCSTSTMSTGSGIWVYNRTTFQDPKLSATRPRSR